MATTAKLQKEKSRSSVIIPRQTAASAARAARNAVNRNLAPSSAAPSPAARSPNRQRNRNSLSPQSQSKESTKDLSTASSNDFTNKTNLENNEINSLHEPENKANLNIVPVASSTDSPVYTLTEQPTSFEEAPTSREEELTEETEVFDTKNNHVYDRDEAFEDQNSGIIQCYDATSIINQTNNPENTIDEKKSNSFPPVTLCPITPRSVNSQFQSPQIENCRSETPRLETPEPNSAVYETPQSQTMLSETPQPPTMLSECAQPQTQTSQATQQLLSETSKSQTKPSETSQIEAPQLQCTLSDISRPKTPPQPETLQTTQSETSQRDTPQPPTTRSEPSRPETPQTLRPTTPASQTSRPQSAQALGPQISAQISKSRPDTPLSNNNLPISSPSSRPQTPRQSSVPASRQSRPVTPASPTTHKKPAISPRTSKFRPPSSSIPVPAGPRNTPHSPANTVCSVVAEEDDIKSLLRAKRKEFQTMKKELDLKQQAILRTYNSLRKITEQLTKEEASALGAQAIQMEEMMVLNVADWPSQEVADLCRDAAASSSYDQNALQLIDNLKQIDENTIAELDGKITNIPSKFSDLCLQAFTARQEIIDWIKQLLEQKGEGWNEHLDKISEYNAQSLQLYEALRIEKTQADNTVSNVTRISKCAFLERGVLIMLGESLVREIAQLKHDLEKKSASVEAANAQIIRDMQRQLEEERAANAALKGKLATAEDQLRQTKMRVSKMDRQLREAEASIVHLTATVKSLEDQNRQREVSFESKARKLKESLRTCEVANNKIVQQRNEYQKQVKSLTEDLERTVADNKIIVNNLQKENKQLKTALEEKSEEVKTKKELEKNLEELRNTVLRETENNKSLEESLSQLRSEFEDYKRIHPEGENELPSEREIDLWAELQATKDTLRITEEEVTACKCEKVRFLETLSKISETEDKVEMTHKLAAELINKEEIIGKMQIQIRELTKNIKHNEQKVTQYEKYARDLQAQKRAVANCPESPNGISYQDLQQEIMNLRMNLLDAVHRNEELSEKLSQKDEQLEQQEKTSRSQARIIKVREELINMLKNKEAEQSKELASLQQDVEYRMKIVEDVNKQIASKADEIQELFVTLENRQQQIHRLEKIVLALEEQQRRAQQQRTRYEEKIAALEHEISAGGHRERKFLFF